jgi:uncharacterized protein (DUF1697 family)
MLNQKMKYVALLRAINVGGHIVTMEKLRNIFTANGFENVSTYIQSGNVLFESKKKESSLVSQIEEMLIKELGYPVPVILRSKNELEQALENNPFKKFAARGEINLYIGFLQQEPSDSMVNENTFDNINILNREVFIMMDKSKGQSIADKMPITKSLEKLMTGRNLNTVNKLIEKLS